MLINSRDLTSHHTVKDDLNKNKNYLFDLSYLSVLDLIGDKAYEFLQGQFSADVRQISSTNMVPGAFCNLQGRILSLAHAISWQGLQLILPADLAEKILKTLINPARLSRVTPQINEHFKVFGFYLQKIDDLLPVHANFPEPCYAQISTTDYCAYHLGHGLYIFIIPNEIETAFCKPFKEQDQCLGSLAWHKLQLRHHHLEIYPESSGLFLPHRLDLHKTPLLSFDKGCYKGQEVIARMHYRANLKHELKFFTIDSHEPLFSGQKIMHEGHEIGELIDYVPCHENRSLIALSLIFNAPQQVLFEHHQKLTHLVPEKLPHL